MAKSITLVLNELIQELRPETPFEGIELFMKFHQELPPDFELTSSERLAVPEKVCKVLTDWMEDLENQIEECRENVTSENKIPIDARGKELREGDTVKLVPAALGNLKYCYSNPFMFVRFNCERKRIEIDIRPDQSSLLAPEVVSFNDSKRCKWQHRSIDFTSPWDLISRTNWVDGFQAKHNTLNRAIMRKESIEEVLTKLKQSFKIKQILEGGYLLTNIGELVDYANPVVPTDMIEKVSS